jgi:hypothetical protein
MSVLHHKILATMTAAWIALVSVSCVCGNSSLIGDGIPRHAEKPCCKTQQPDEQHHHSPSCQHCQPAVLPKNTVAQELGIASVTIPFILISMEHWNVTVAPAFHSRSANCNLSPPIASMTLLSLACALNT